MVDLSRRLSAVAPALIRRLSTAVKAAAPREGNNRLYRRLSALGHKTGTVSSSIDEYIREGRTVTKVELERCISELRRYKRYGNALEIMEWMESQKFNFKHSNYAVRLDLTGKVKGIAAAEDYFNGLSPSNRVHCIYGALLNCYCKEKLTDKALDIFAKMVKEKMITKPLPYNSLMSMYYRLGEHDKVLVLGEQMKKVNIRPDTFTYINVMNSHAQLSDIEGVDRAFEEIKLKNEKDCDWTVYSNLANIYINAGYQEKAKLALQNVEKKMGSNNREAHNVLISLWAQLSDLDQVYRIWKSLKSTKAVIINRSYQFMLKALGNLGDIEGMTKCYKEWESVCSGYDIKLTNAVIRAYLQHNMVEEAESVLEVAMSRSAGPFFNAWDQIMNFYLDTNQIKRALQLMDTATSKSQEFKWQPGFVVDKFLAYFKQESDVHSAEEFYKMMKRINCVDGCVYGALLETYKAAGETMLDMRARIEGDGVEISGEIEHLLASVCPQ